MKSHADIFLHVSHAFEGDLERRRNLYRSHLHYFTPDDTVVDIGCGDGIWLELLRDAGIRGVGVDQDPAKRSICKSKGLDVLDAANFDMIGNALTAFHLVEHLEPMQVIELLSNWRWNKILIITPNIEHPSVHGTFWKDISHVRPYPSCVLVEILKEVGMNSVEATTQADGWDVVVYGERSRK
ncbi:class I SAM-dependent methyltransferase [Alicyclobacillus tolerans]|uniref:class I SAM-dependent methyltransferase n=1 Tax=Alicyclobacillus tolerans TaxID=90970 RepID=UPI003B798021